MILEIASFVKTLLPPCMAPIHTQYSLNPFEHPINPLIRCLLGDGGLVKRRQEITL